MADDILLQGKSYPWLVDELGRAHVVVKASTEYMTLYDAVDETTAYVGKALPGTLTSSAGWQIKKLTFNVEGDVIMQFADGDSNMDNVWDDRANLTYL